MVAPMNLSGWQPRPKEKVLAEIEALIRRENLWGLRLPGERDMAERLGVSRGTVQRALLFLETRGVVVRRHGSGTYAAEADATTSRAARGGKRLAVLVSAPNRPGESWTYYGDMVQGILRRAARLGASAEILPLEQVWLPGPGPAWNRLRDFDAHLVVERDDHALIHQLFKLRRGPVVVLDSTYRDLPVIGVVDGSFQGARLAVQHLIGLGHRRIAHLSPRERAEVTHDKTRGYEAALAEAGLPLDPALVAFPPRQGETIAEAAIDLAVEEFMALPDPPTAIFAGTDDRALPALRALETRGWRVGEDFAVVGFGDQAFRLGQCDRLTSVRINTRQMGEAAVQAALEAEPPKDGRTIIVPDRLIVRASSCRRREEGTGFRVQGSGGKGQGTEDGSKR